MANKFVVMWTRRDSVDQRLMPIDDENFCESPEEAKQAGRSMLPRIRSSDLMPVEVLGLDEDAILEYVASDREIVDVGGLEFVRIR